MTPRLPQDIRRPDSTTMVLLRESRTAIAARPVDLSAAVYRHLPTFAPRTKELMAAELRLHGERIVQELLRAVEILDAMATLEEDLRRLGAEHATYHGVPAEHYPYVGQALVRAVRELFPNSEGGMLGSAWMEVYEWIAAQMMQGAVAAASSTPTREPEVSPAYWRAYVEPAEPPSGGSAPEDRVDPARDQTVSFDRGELFERLARVDDVDAPPRPTPPPVRPVSPAPRLGPPAVRPVSPAAGSVPPPPGAVIPPPGVAGPPPSVAGPPPGRTGPPAAGRGGRPRRARNPWTWGSRFRNTEPSGEAAPTTPPPVDPNVYDSPPQVTPPQNLDLRRSGVPAPREPVERPDVAEPRQVPVVPEPRPPTAEDVPTEVFRLEPGDLDAPRDSHVKVTGSAAVGESAAPPVPPSELGDGPAVPRPAASSAGLRGVGTGWPSATTTTTIRPVRPAQAAVSDPPDLGDAPAQE